MAPTGGIATSHCGLLRMPLSILFAACLLMIGISGEFDRLARGSNGITTHNTRVTCPVMLDARTLVYLATDADGSGPWMYTVDVERRRSRRISSGLGRLFIACCECGWLSV